jgi:hypothetical protein
MSGRLLLLAVASAALSILSGCGGASDGRRAVSGQVLLNGNPLTSGSIEFSPLAPGGVQSGALIEAGQYAIPRDQGLTPGEYRVAIIDSPPAAPLPAGHMPGDPLPPPPKPQVPASWNSKSQQKVTVGDTGAAKFDFEIKTK